MCRETTDAVPIDAENLPGYAGQLLDSYQQRPWVQRIAAWYRLERAGTADPIPDVLVSNTAKVQAVAQAQDKGVLPSHFPASVLLGLVVHISGFWSSDVPEFDALVSDRSVTARRQAVVDAVAA